MNERGLKVLEKYDFHVLGTKRGRGTFVCETDKGLKLIMEFSGTGKRLAFQNEVLKKLQECGYRLVDTVVENMDGELITTDRDETAYVVKDWFEGRECDTGSEEDILQAVRNLALLHKQLRMEQTEFQGLYIGEKLSEEYYRHNRELKKTWSYIKGRRQKNTFERCYLEHVKGFMEQALQAQQILKDSDADSFYEKQIHMGCICHGDYNQHQMLFTKKGIATTNFSKCRYDVQIGDLYQFMRKILEKQNWNIKIGEKMLEEYDKNLSIGREEKQYLRIRFGYPEKFWKLANYYYNHKKSWISSKNVEKMQLLVMQQQKKDAFLKMLDL